MQLEEAIKQSKDFENPYEKAIVNLVYTHSWLINETKSHFNKFGITPKQYNILRILQGAGKPVSTSFIKERLLEKQSDVSRIINRMHSKNWVIRKDCQADKRLVDLELSTEGREKLVKIETAKHEIQTIMNNLSEKEIKTLNRLLDKVRK